MVKSGEHLPAFDNGYNIFVVNASGKDMKGPTKGSSPLTRNERIALIVFFVLALGWAGWKYFGRLNSGVELGKDIHPQGGGIVVQVEGAVKSPGLVYLPQGARVSDAVEAAGGFTSEADREAVNLAETVRDGQKIQVPYLSQRGGDGSSSARDTGVSFRRVEYPLSPQPDGDLPSGLVNINKANQYELETLPGIGEQLALRIIAYRNTRGRFEKIEDIMLVEGIGEGKFEDIRSLITVED